MIRAQRTTERGRNESPTESIGHLENSSKDVASELTSNCSAPDSLISVDCVSTPLIPTAAPRSGHSPQSLSAEGHAEVRRGRRAGKGQNVDPEPDACLLKPMFSGTSSEPSLKKHLILH